MIKFKKVSFEEFERSFRNIIADIGTEGIRKIYDGIKLPQRSTPGSAGYDFYAPFDIELMPTTGLGETAWNTFPTGISFETDRDDIVLLCFPRSGLGFKNQVRLANTVGVIDSDYWHSDNEGHIMVKLTAGKSVSVEAGKAFMQGVFIPFLKTDDDMAIEADRNGGFGSTDKRGK